MTEPQRIHALPLHLANQIAAGEVIERPASVVKELIENSLDAGATDITIHIEGAGSKLIQIRDNGHGIHPDDLVLALNRHATSKLTSTEQLSQIASLGFRGEALPSIASIAQLTLSSKQANNEHAWQYDATREIAHPTTHPDGTTIEVRDLFFNVPARRHFLKGDKTELNHIVTTIRRLALSQFETGFHGQLSASNNLKLPAAKTNEQRQQRIAKICGKTFLNNSLYIKQSYDDIELHGWVATAEGHRPQTDVHYFFINGRVIRDRVINHAIRQAYADYIPDGRYPAFVLYLTMPLDRLDINVHPTKHEVRFRDARLIHGLINKALSDALSQEGEIKDRPEPEKQAQQGVSIPVFTSAPAALQSTIAETKKSYERASRSTALPNTNFGTVITLLEQRYLLTRAQDQHLLLDLQTAEQQLRQQQFQYAIGSNTLSTRPILVPIKLTMTAQETEALRLQQTALQQFGFAYNLNGTQLHITAIPSLFAQCHLPQLLKNLASEITTETDNDHLQHILQQLLPMLIIQTLEQALQILPQLSELPITQKWVRELDNETLKRLFEK
jgi:DNA mismatch repair protein MutL